MKCEKVISLLCDKQSGGCIHSHNTELAVPISADTLIQKIIPKAAWQFLSDSREASSLEQLKEARSTKSDANRLLISHLKEYRRYLSNETVEKFQKNHTKFPESISKLDASKTFVKEMGLYLDHAMLLKLRKKEVLYKNWVSRVYEPLRRSILEEMGGKHYDELTRRKRELHKQYIEYKNRNGFVSLDIDESEEYYSMALHGHRPAPLKVNVRRLSDPLLSEHRKRSEEERMIVRCLTGSNLTDKDIEQIKLPPIPLIPLGRRDKDYPSWFSVPPLNAEWPSRLIKRQPNRNAFIGSMSTQATPAAEDHEEENEENNNSSIIADHKVVDMHKYCEADIPAGTLQFGAVECSTIESNVIVENM